ncbi:MAG: hypothetical protein KDA92_05085 [Planctomycetales bacterium]|nr:hypothetical protein [Planctomycetales bacterium]MCA9167981.1 hypothetical protein [Planctomycetales bacterium]
MSLKHCLCVVSIMMTLAFSPPLTASTYTWTGEDSHDWNDPGNWTGAAGTPDDEYDVAIVNIPSPYVLVDVHTPDPPPPPDYVRGLQISNGGDVINGLAGEYHPMLHVRDVSISGKGSQLTIFRRTISGIHFIGPAFWANDVDIANGASLHFVDDPLTEIGGIYIHEGSSMYGAGTIELFGSILSLNEGEIAANGGDLIIEQRVGDSSTIDLDGVSEAGRLHVARDSKLQISAPLTPNAANFNGTIQVDREGTLEIDTNWTLDTGGVMDLWGADSYARVTGNPLRIEGDANIKSGRGQFEIPVTVANAGVVSIAANQAASFTESVDVTTNGHITAHNLSVTDYLGPVIVNSNGEIQLQTDAVNTFRHGLLVEGNGQVNIDDATGVFHQTTTVRNAGAAINVENGGFATYWDAVYLYDDGGIVADSGNAYFANYVNVRSGGRLSLTGSGAADLNGTLMVQDGGIIDVGDAGTIYFDGPTTIAADAGDLELNRAGTMFVNNTMQVRLPIFDWDGQPVGKLGADTTTVVQADGNLSIFATNIDTDGTDKHDSRIELSGSLSVNVADHEWQMNGEMTVSTGAVNGDTLSVTGDLLIVNSGASMFNAPLHMDDLGFLSVGTQSTLNLTAGGRFEAGSRSYTSGVLDLQQGAFTFGGGVVRGAGTMLNNSRSYIEAAVAWETTSLDWDGSSENGTTRITPGNSLIVLSALTDAMSGIVTVDSGVLDVSSNWTVDSGGVVALDQHTTSPILRGGELTLSSGSQLTVHNSNATIEAPLVLRTGSRLRNLNATAQADLHGGITFLGGQIVEDVSGTTVRLLSPATVIGSSVVDVTTYDWDQAPTTLEPGSSLTINATNLGLYGDNSHNNQITVNGASLNVNVAGGEWQLGTLSSLTLNSSSGAAYLLGSSLSVAQGQLVAIGPDAILNAPLRVLGSGTIQVASADDRLRINGTASLLGGTYTGLGTLQINSDLQVLAGLQRTVINVAHLDMDGTAGTDSEFTVRENASLTVNANTLGDVDNAFEDTLVLETNSELLMNTTVGQWTVRNGSLNFNALESVATLPTLSGDDLHIDQGGLVLGNGHVTANVTNDRGTIAPGRAVDDQGVIVIDGDYVQGKAATLHINVGRSGRVLSHNRVEVGQVASLAGYLNVQPMLGYAVPTLRGQADVFDVIHFATSQAEFAKVAYDGDVLEREFVDGRSFQDHIDEGLFHLVRYQTDSVQFINYLAFAGDANGDGQFNTTDLVVALQAGEYEDGVFRNSTWTEGDWNGDDEFTSSDLVAALQTGKFETGPTFATPTVPEPHALSLLTAALTGLLLLHRRHAL